MGSASSSPVPREGTAALEDIARDVVACEACPRLVEHCRTVARVKKKAYRDWEYWGGPLPGFGDPAADLIVIGLAPAAHGGNRTGRMFTGDSSADWLVRAMHRAGFANQPESRDRDDGLRLLGAYITAAGRCAPPQNRPTAEELENCRPFLIRELDALPYLRVVVVLGQIAFDAYIRILRERGQLTPDRPRPKFQHGAVYRPTGGWPVLIASYHPSRQNTQTGRLTEPMLDDVFVTARGFTGPPAEGIRIR